MSDRASGPAAGPPEQHAYRAAAPPSLEQWHREGRWFDFRGRKIFWREGGEGRPLLLVHGFPTASWDWRHLWSPLCKSYRVICLDMLGFGWSEKPPRHAYTIAEQADLQTFLLAARGIERCHVLAHDYGDTVAQEMLARHIEGAAGLRLSSLCLLNGGLFPEAHRPLAVQKLLAGPLGWLVAKMIPRALFERSMRRIFGPATPPTREELDGFWRLINHNDGRAAVARLIRYMAERRKWRTRWVEALTRAPIPVRLIDGTADPIAGTQLVERYRGLVPRPDVLELPGIGHYPQIEAPQAVLSGLLELHARCG